MIAFEDAAVVNEDDLAFANDLRLEGAVGECGVFADLTACIAGDAALRLGCVDELREMAVGHAGLRGFVTGFVD